MPEFVRFLSQMREHMNAELTRSDVLRPLIWPNAGLMFLLATSLAANAPTWFIQSVLALLAVFMVLYGVAYVFFAFTDSDALRSEKYKLQKLAIKQGLYGDSSIGLKQVEDIPDEDKLLEAHPVVGIAND
ncbi:hypothetical protein RMS29_001785 [Agrobacterium rosae]|uniref:Uncharacterized protein n=1 Tax=Agrobacterium rosae TaxID=1972867 RepID=A0ABU4VVW7_9HYPH|nr:hypothetical protein [Agrobacterium rosae]MDX8329650.1 hypothetical protein [Agrobacterium rosae]